MDANVRIQTANRDQIDFPARHRLPQTFRFGIGEGGARYAQFGGTDVAADATHRQDEKDNAARDNNAVWPLDYVCDGGVGEDRGDHPAVQAEREVVLLP